MILIHKKNKLNKYIECALNNYYLFFIFLTFFYFFNIFLIKNKILLDKIESSQHKKFLVSESVPLSGGVLIFVAIIFLMKDLSYFNKILLSAVFVLGLSSDLQRLKSPILRLFLQFFIVFIILVFNENYISQTRLFYLDYLIENFFIIKFLFTAFCLLILMNGTNFIDGVNGLSVGYFIIILLNILFISSKLNLNLDENLIILLNFLIIFLIFNLFSRSFMGDSGSYLLSTYVGLYLISFFNNYQNLISPYYICLLLWYPAFENLFSILRRKFVKQGFTTYADNEHLHHFLFKILNKNINNTKVCNSLSGFTINSINFLFIFIGSHYLSNTKILSMLIILLICIYLLFYFFLKKIILQKDNKTDFDK